MANYNAIYGTMAALPIFLVWVYTSWLIVLFGLEVVYAHQYHATRAAHSQTGTHTGVTRDMLALSTLLLVCSHFHAGAPPSVPQQLSDELGIRLHEMEELLETLKNLHFLAKVSENGSGWLPAREPSVIKLDEVLTALRGGLPQAEEAAATWKTAIDVFARESNSRSESLKGVTIHDLMMGERTNEAASTVTAINAAR
jgi:membrane protein